MALLEAGQNSDYIINSDVFQEEGQYGVKWCVNLLLNGAEEKWQMPNDKIASQVRNWNVGDKIKVSRVPMDGGKSFYKVEKSGEATQAPGQPAQFANNRGEEMPMSKTLGDPGPMEDPWDSAKPQPAYYPNAPTTKMTAPPPPPGAVNLPYTPPVAQKPVSKPANGSPDWDKINEEKRAEIGWSIAVKEARALFGETVVMLNEVQLHTILKNAQSFYHILHNQRPK